MISEITVKKHIIISFDEGDAYLLRIFLEDAVCECEMEDGKLMREELIEHLEAIREA